MLESCMRPELVAEISMQPVRRYGVDAAILYSDIMLPLKAAGVDLDIVSGRGPVIARPIQASGDLEQLRPLDPERLWYVTEAVGLITSQLGERSPDRLCWCAVYVGQLSDRGRAESGLRGDEGFDDQ